MTVAASGAILPGNVSRSALCSFVGRGFLITEPEELAEYWRTVDPKGQLDAIPRALEGLSRDDLEREYVRLFLAPEGAPCPPWQSVHEDDAQLMGASHQSALEWFRTYGVEPAKDSEPADHVGLLLSFYGHLLDLESEALPEFEARHLGWISAFCERLERQTPLEFYRLLAVYTRSALTGIAAPPSQA
jgi:TorA maturation chaperone TorD